MYTRHTANASVRDGGCPQNRAPHTGSGRGRPATGRRGGFSTLLQQSGLRASGCPPVCIIIKTRQLSFFGHVARSDSRQDHHRAISASCDCSRPQGHLCTTWLRGTDADVQSAEISIHSAWRKDNDLWRRSSTPRHSTRGMPLKKKKQFDLLYCCNVAIKMVQ